jgi:AcrR family transcriptional regulator
MSRPRSEDKRRAILEAAARVFAERGIADSPTSAISRAAGVAEGSLFTYFRTKEELMNELYLEFRREFGREVADFQRRRSVRAQMRHLWDRYLTMGTEQPERLRVQAQLRASGKLFKEHETPIPALLELLETARRLTGGNGLKQTPPEYLVLMMRAQAEATIEYIAAHPEQKKECWEAGFRICWKGIAGK